MALMSSKISSQAAILTYKTATAAASVSDGDLSLLLGNLVLNLLDNGGDLVAHVLVLLSVPCQKPFAPWLIDSILHRLSTPDSSLE